MSFLKCKQYSQRYKKSWEAEELFKGWLTSCEEDVLRGFCKVCKVTISARRKDLSDHAKTKKHENNMKTSVPSNQITKFLRVPEKKEFQTKELRLAMFIAEHTSIKCIDHLGELLKALDAEHFNIKLHRTKCTGLITEILAPELKKELIEDIGQSSYSLIIDESNDCSNIKCLGAIIRYWSVAKKAIVDTMYCLLPLDVCDAVGITISLLTALRTDELNIKNLCGVGVDGANTMVGQHHSVTTLLRKEAGDHLIMNRCICHSLHLAAYKASETLPRNLDFMVKETCSWFSQSHKRRLEYEKVYKTLHNDQSPLKLSNLSTTRWLARRDVVGKILEQWNALSQHFNHARVKERCYTAELLYQMYSDSTNKFYFTYIFYILDDVARVNSIFQSKQPNVLLMFDDLAGLYLGLLKKIVVPDHMKKVNASNVLEFQFEKYLMHTESMYFGYEFRLLEATKEKSVCSEIKERCRTFLIQLLKEIRQRMPDNLKILMMLKEFSPRQIILSMNPEHFIIPIPEKFKHFIQDVDSCLSEWQKLSDEPELMNFIKTDTSNIVGFWFHVFQIENACGEQKFKNISKLALTLLTCPLSNASVERLFSQMNAIKRKIRNRLLVRTTEKILLVRHCMEHVRRENCVNFKPSDDMLNLFKSDNIYVAHNDYDCSEIYENYMLNDIIDEI